MAKAESPTIYLITGSNRGIGLALVNAILARDDSIVYAGVRDYNHVTELQALVSQYGKERLRLIKITSACEEDNAIAMQQIEEDFDHIDVIIANAGLVKEGSLVETPLQDFRDVWEVNALGPIVLYRAARHLLVKSSKPRFFWISSKASVTYSIRGTFPFGAYASSKAAANYLSKKLHYEEPQLISVAFHPGLVMTGPGQHAMDIMGLTSENTQEIDINPITPEQCADKLLACFDRATRDTHGGTFRDEEDALISE